MMLNSFWGKFGQRDTLRKTAFFSEPAEFFDLATKDSVKIYSIVPINEDVIQVCWRNKDEFIEIQPNTNVPIACYMTAQARLHLYGYLEKLQRRVLYFDTDSVIYKTAPGEPRLSTGSYLGELTNELEGYGPGAHIYEFVSGGPKNYGYKVRLEEDGETVGTTIKVKGLTMNATTGKVLQFDTMKRQVASFLAGTKQDETLVKRPYLRRTELKQLVTKMEHKTYWISFDKRRVLPDGSTLPFGWRE